MTLLILLAFLACDHEPVAHEPTDNAAVPVDTLFTKDGCTVYRFYDGGRNRYFARCEGAATTTTMSTESCGKGCTEEVGVPAVMVPG